MCFSKEVSYGATVLLATSGILSLAITSKRKQWRFYPFAIIPLLFAIQQLSEGFVWQAFEQGSNVVDTFFSGVYLFFAFALWPFWIPFSLACIERKKKKLFTFLTLYGFVVGACIFGLSIYTANPLKVSLVNRSLAYTEGFPFPYHIGFILYSIATIASAISSSYLRIQILGISFALFALITYLMNQLAFISLWCFFSAILSIGIVWILYKETELSI